MKRQSIGVTGHQPRPGIDWGWVAEETRRWITKLADSETRAYSCLAAGADQVFAREALALGLDVHGILPMPNYERKLEEEDRSSFLELASHCELVTLPGASDDASAYMIASRYIVDRSDRLLAIWDGEPAAGPGGTADVVDHAIFRNVPVTRLDPFLRIVSTISGEPL